MALIRISALFLLILFVLGTGGCGKTGALYLPDEKPVAFSG
jgi:predicted small lipoprotein YifL